MEAQPLEKTMSDHDVLITLVSTVNNNQVTVLDKMQDLKLKIQEVNDGISAKVNEHEMKLQAIEKIMNEINPMESYLQLKQNTQWIHDWKVRVALFYTLAGIIGGLVAWILSNIHLINFSFK